MTEGGDELIDGESLMRLLCPPKSLGLERASLGRSNSLAPRGEEGAGSLLVIKKEEVAVDALVRNRRLKEELGEEGLSVRTSLLLFETAELGLRE